ncbi:RNA-directed DNA polymerase [Nostoc sp. CENA67]|uniref:RNA-directed DNA polymerase n=1 Tax=Amazonocrinis nigriterrae CENA67 TaxID=2794033 RepID=A0A8J7HXA8_9NOST|nr:RNA-directed DNA polymerase [Amazonocrinis nigriterrae]MBH8564089.1 RNA-directed DNA polymerase [Amazonocrinis nigriterrae CENA67]
MKRYGNLWNEIIAFNNLLSAAQQAQRGKRFRDNVLVFNYNLEKELFQLQEELQSKRYCPGTYTTFQIYEPKPRMISAAPYRDRVVHHALCNILVPIFERTFISDSYANRVGFGSHRALHRFTKFCRSSRYVLQADIRKYFPSIDHEILKSIIYRKIKCPDTLWLINTIIDHSNPQEPVLNYFPLDDLLTPLQRRCGLPIGNLTSQFFANVYLNNFDHFIKEQIKASRYIRYVDDFALFSNDQVFLEAAKNKIEEYLSSLRLKIHPIKSQLFETKHGANFVGFRILPNQIRIRSDNLRMARKRLRQMLLDCHEGKIEPQKLAQSIQSWVAHLKHGDTWQLRQQIFSSLLCDLPC